MIVSVSNAQREATVDRRRVARLVRLAARRLSIRVSGTMSVTFITSRRMRQLNKRFLRHDRPTDVLSFRYDGPSARPDGLARDVASRNIPARLHELVVGEIVIAPREAKTYARRHGIPYEEELARYVVHGLLHWLGHEDATVAQQRKMRAMEDRLLVGCRF